MARKAREVAAEEKPVRVRVRKPGELKLVIKMDNDGKVMADGPIDNFRLVQLMCDGALELSQKRCYERAVEETRLAEAAKVAKEGGQVPLPVEFMNHVQITNPSPARKPPEPDLCDMGTLNRLDTELDKEGFKSCL